MTIPFGRYLRNTVLAAVCLVACEANQPQVQASGWIVPLAQAQAAPPSTAMPGKLYVVEGIVIVVLFAAALFAVCRSSGRT